MSPPHLPPRWVVSVSLAVAAAILGDSLLYAVLPIVWPELGLDVQLVGVLLAANRFVRPLANPVAGRLMSRFGVRGPLLAALLASALSTAAYAARAGFVAFLLARVVWGVCWSFLRLAGIIAALESSGDRRRGYYLGFFNGTARVGSFVAVLAGGALTDLVGFETTVYLFAAASLGGFLFLLRQRPPLATTAAVAGGREDDVAPAPPAARRLAGASRALAVIDACNLLQGMAVSGLVSATLGLWLIEQYGQKVDVGAIVIGIATLNGALLGVRFVADTLAGPLAGHLSDRHGRLVVLHSAGAVQALAFAALSLAGSLSWTAAAAVALFIAGAAVQVALDASAGDLAPPTTRAQRMSRYATWWDVGAAAGPLFGYLLGPVVGLAWIYRAMAAALALGTIAGARALRRA
jgi:MFS family permease